MTIQTETDQVIYSQLKQLKSDARILATLSEAKINQVLLDLADFTESAADEILKANALDLERMDPSNPKYDRLLLNQDRILGIAADLRKVAQLPFPIGKESHVRVLENGLKIKKVSVPLGIVGVVYESRPNVTFDVFSLCFKAGNATVLKGSRDAHYSNLKIVELLQQVLAKHGLPKLVILAPSERSALGSILEADDFIDTIIPRGGKGLIDYVRANAKVPVIETGAGIVHTYVDKSADTNKAKAIIANAKTRRVSVCNALDTLLIHESRLKDLPEFVATLDKTFQLQIFADAPSFEALKDHYDPSLLHPAEVKHFGIEFLSMKMAIKVVPSLDDALIHIFHHSSKHSEAIVSEAPEAIQRFLNEVDAAVVYANTSTAFTDGAQFGLGAEIGISTQKLHARGPMGLEELTSYKWVVEGDGQTRM